MIQEVSVRKAPYNLINASAMEVLSYEKTNLIRQYDMRLAGIGQDQVPADEKVAQRLMSDSYAYYVAINSWLCQVSDIAGVRAAKALAAIISDRGFVSTIGTADEIASAIHTNNELWTMDQVSVDLSGLWEVVLDCQGVGATQVLQILEYPKRFSCWFRGEVLKELSLQKFLDLNRKHADWARAHKAAPYTAAQHMKAMRYADRGASIWLNTGRSEDIEYYCKAACLRRMCSAVPARTPQPMSDYWIKECQEVAQWLYHGTLGIRHKIKKADRFRVHPDNTIDADAWTSDSLASYTYDVQKGPHGYFSSGKTAEGFQDGITKRLEYARYFAYYKGYMLPGEPSPLQTIPHVSRICPVNKSWKACRIIAQEYVPSAYSGQAVNAYIQRRVKGQHNLAYSDRYDSTNQERNRRLAVRGSNTGLYATIDLSGASDSISKAFAKLVMPYDVYELIESVQSDQLLVRNKLYRNHILLTSGTGLTFDNESNLFLIICIACERVYERWTTDRVLPSVVYGDDMLVDVRIYDMVSEVLTSGGFVVNDDKSYTTGTKYRESCGIEAYDGYWYNLLYYPRSGLDFLDPVGVAVQLTALQKKAYYLYPTMAQFFKAVVLDMCPGMTCSQPGTECDDLWGSESLNPIVYPPHRLGEDWSKCTSSEGIDPSMEPLLRRYAHATLVARPDHKLYSGMVKDLSPSDKERLEVMRYVETLEEMSHRPAILDSQTYGGITIPVVSARNKVAAYGLTKTTLELR